MGRVIQFDRGVAGRERLVRELTQRQRNGQIQDVLALVWTSDGEIELMVAGDALETAPREVLGNLVLMQTLVTDAILAGGL